MSGRRVHILLPEDRLQKIDASVGPRGRNAFLVKVARKEVRRRKLLGFLGSRGPTWQERDHPDLAGSSSTWVRNLRQG